MSRPPEAAPTFIEAPDLEALVAQAQAHPRRRINWNFHPDPEHPCHRLAIAMEPTSYIPPHCHSHDTKGETLLALKGRLGLLIFGADGRVTHRRVLSPGGPCSGATLPPGTLHSLVALESGSVFFESKAGPYAAPTGPECPAWAPREGSPEAETYLAGMHREFA